MEPIKYILLCLKTYFYNTARTAPDFIWKNENESDVVCKNRLTAIGLLWGKLSKLHQKERMTHCQKYHSQNSVCGVSEFWNAQNRNNIGLVNDPKEVTDYGWSFGAKFNTFHMCTFNILLCTFNIFLYNVFRILHIQHAICSYAAYVMLF